jgi:hypothetical protein
MAAKTPQNTLENLDFQSFKTAVLNDYRLACISRETSLLGRKEVLTGKAKFGIFGDGKELENERMYTVAVQGYLSAGKDGYTTLKNGNILKGGDSAPVFQNIVDEFFGFNFQINLYYI